MTGEVMSRVHVTAILAGYVVASSIVAGLAAEKVGQPPGVFAAPKLAGFGASLSADQAVYRSGEPISITFEVFNHAPRTVRLNFATSQRFDVVIEDNKGREIWRWSSGRMFAMVLGEETLGPAKPRLTYEAQYADNLQPGSYTIKAVLTDTERRISAVITVLVE